MKMTRQTDSINSIGVTENTLHVALVFTETLDTVNS